MTWSPGTTAWSGGGRRGRPEACGTGSWRASRVRRTRRGWDRPTMRSPCSRPGRRQRNWAFAPRPTTGARPSGSTTSTPCGRPGRSAATGASTAWSSMTWATGCTSPTWAGTSTWPAGWGSGRWTGACSRSWSPVRTSTTCVRSGASTSWPFPPATATARAGTTGPCPPGLTLPASSASPLPTPGRCGRWARTGSSTPARPGPRTRACPAGPEPSAGTGTTRRPRTPGTPEPGPRSATRRTPGSRGARSRGPAAAGRPGIPAAGRRRTPAPGIPARWSGPPPGNRLPSGIGPRPATGPATGATSSAGVPPAGTPAAPPPAGTAATRPRPGPRAARRPGHSPGLRPAAGTRAT